MRKCTGQNENNLPHSIWFDSWTDTTLELSSCLQHVLPPSQFYFPKERTENARDLAGWKNLEALDVSWPWFKRLKTNNLFIYSLATAPYSALEWRSGIQPLTQLNPCEFDSRHYRIFCQSPSTSPSMRLPFIKGVTTCCPNSVTSRISDPNEPRNSTGQMQGKTPMTLPHYMKVSFILQAVVTKALMHRSKTEQLPNLNCFRTHRYISRISKQKTSKHQWVKRDFRLNLSSISCFSWCAPYIRDSDRNKKENFWICTVTLYTLYIFLRLWLTSI